jgi:1-acyl-sn-glycerol-3-phosphate acyltransferase
VRIDLAFYAFVRAVVSGFCRLFWREAVEGAEHIPERGAFILAPVHRSNVDSPLVAGITRRRLRYMGKDTMWKLRPFGWLWSALGAFPVRRGSADREALRRCGEVLAEGEALVVFPEGTRRSGPVVEDLYEGAAYLAIRAQVPIVPVGIAGSEEAMPRAARFIKPVKVHVIVGPPIEPPPRGPGGRAPRQAVHKLTQVLQEELQGVFDQARSRLDSRR